VSSFTDKVIAFGFPEIRKRIYPLFHGGVCLRMPAKNKTNLAKTPPFSRFLSNSRLKYVWYICTRLYQKSSKISTFWLLASLTADF